MPMLLHPEHIQICEAFLPVNVATAANDGDWVSMKNYEELLLVYYQAPGTAAEPATITVEQATDVSGTSGKGLNFTTVFEKKAATNTQSTGQFTKVTQSAANTYALGTGANGDKAAIIAIYFRAEDLDGENGFDCVRGRVADVGTGPAIGAMLYLLGRARYTPPPSAIAN